MMDLSRLFIFIHLAVQLPVRSLAAATAKHSRLRGAAASRWRREIQAITTSGRNHKEKFLVFCQVELREAATNGIISRDNYAAFLASYCKTNPSWACTYDTSYFWRLDPRLQRVFVSERCPGDAFHQQECLEYVVEHPDQEFGYTGDPLTLCSVVEPLLVPTGLVREIKTISNLNNYDEVATRGQGLVQSQSQQVNNYTGRNKKSKGGRKRDNNNDGVVASGDAKNDEEKAKDEKGDEERGGGTKKRREGNEKEKVRDEGAEHDNDKGKGSANDEGKGQGNKEAEGEEKGGEENEKGDQNSYGNITGDSDESPLTNNTTAADHQNISVNVDEPEGSLHDGTSSISTNAPVGSDREDKKEARKDPEDEMSGGLQNEPSNASSTNGGTQNNKPQTDSTRPKAEDMLGSEGFNNQETTKRETENVKKFVFVMIGSVGLVLLLGIGHKTRAHLITRNEDAWQKGELDEENGDISLSSSDNDIFVESGDNALEAALSFIDQRTQEEMISTVRQKRGIGFFFARFVGTVRSNGSTASDSDSAVARCGGDVDDSDNEDLSIRLTERLSRMNTESIKKKTMSQPKGGWRHRHFVNNPRRNTLSSTVERILSQIEESPCESEISGEESSMSEFTESRCDEVIGDAVNEQVKEVEGKITEGISSTQILYSPASSPLTNLDPVVSEGSSCISMRDQIEMRNSGVYVYRGGAGSSGPDSSTTSDAESSCSSTVNSR